MKRTIAILVFTLSLCNNAKAQNLVPNSSFEIYDTCPNLEQINYAIGWKSYSDYAEPEYYDSCASTVPYTDKGYQKDCFQGRGYVGLFMFDKNDPNNGDRDYIISQLSDTLKNGKKYLASMYVSRSEGVDYGVATIGMLFTDTSTHLSGTQTSIITIPQVKNNYLLIDTLNWILIQDTVVMTSNKYYLTIGNFNTTVSSDTTKLTNYWPSFPISYYFLDDVSVYDVTGGACNNYWDAGLTKYITVGDSIRLGAINTDNSTYTWINSTGGGTYLNSNNDARPWAQPTVTTTYYVTKTCPNNNVFKDTVTVYVDFVAGIKQLTSEISVNVYPNPSKDKIYIEGKEIEGIKLFDILGKEIISTKEKEIDVTGFKNGVYFIQVQTNQNTYTQKIIVQH